MAKHKSRRHSPVYRRKSRLLGWVFRWRNFRLILIGGIACILLFAGYVTYLNYKIRDQFEGKRWSIPARVYARPLELYPELRLNAEQFQNELSVLAYRPTSNPKLPGSYFRNGNHFLVITRPFTFWDAKEPSLAIRLDFAGDRLVSLRHAHRGVPLPLVRMDPGIIGRIYPSHNEDRVLVKLEDLPPILVKALITVEDRTFYTHHGVSPRSIARALWANLRAGSTVQGGSTLTQQLVKNFFLTNERTLWRKANEAVMALLLDWHYEKDEILEAYINEIYLGQDGRRAIHGFGLASYFYFERPLSRLRDDQIALLVAMVKGPSYYSPRRQAKRATERRDLVLDLLQEHGVVTDEQVALAKIAPLDVTKRAKSSITSYPAFMDLVRRQLRRDYKDEDLSTEGLQIFTTLDPMVQYESERALKKRLKQLGSSIDAQESKLQSAAIVVSVDGGEVLSVVGDRSPQFAGFNRALDAVRPIGSLIKPAVYLSALAQPGRYTLATLIDDGPLSYEMDGGDVWEPQNFDHQYHGLVPLYRALAKSYNLSTARLGLDIGVPAVINTLRRLGIERQLKPYPSLLLGAIALTPIEVTQMYHTLSTGGFRTPLRAIREIMTSQGEPLQRYPLSVEKVFDGAPVYLLNTALYGAVRNGTGRAVYYKIPESTIIAGKTGTSDDLRDSWFAGYTQDKLGVVWIGKDNNDPMGLTGSAGALRVWADIFQNINPQSSALTKPMEIETALIDTESGLIGDSDCDDTVTLPFIKGSVPVEVAPCAGGGGSSRGGWFKGLF